MLWGGLLQGTAPLRALGDRQTLLGPSFQKASIALHTWNICFPEMCTWE